MADELDSIYEDTPLRLLDTDEYSADVNGVLYRTYLPYNIKQDSRIKELGNLSSISKHCIDVKKEVIIINISIFENRELILRKLMVSQFFMVNQMPHS